MLGIIAAAAVTGGCQATGNLIRTLLEERPPLPIRSFGVASDARLDSLGRLRGSLVGEGTARAVHLLSSDTALIADLIRTHRPDIVRRGDLWGSLARAGLVTIDPGAVQQGPGRRERILAGSPAGHTEVRLASVLVRGSRCGWRGAQAELIVEPPPTDRDGPALLGPVVGSFQGGRAYSRPVFRPVSDPPGDGLLDTLLTWTSDELMAATDSLLPGPDRPVTPLGDPRLAVNTLLDVNAVDVVPIQAGSGRTRYVVSLRRQALTARGDTVMAATVMVWDSAGTWRQVIFRPTVFDDQYGGLRARRGLAPVYWRRLQAMSGFGYDRDYVWMEQVDPRDGTVLWGVIEPWANVVVAAAEVAGPCQ